MSGFTDIIILLKHEVYSWVFFSALLLLWFGDTMKQTAPESVSTLLVPKSHPPAGTPASPYFMAAHCFGCWETQTPVYALTLRLQRSFHRHLLHPAVQNSLSL